MRARVLEVRTLNVKGLEEKRNDYLSKMEGLLNTSRKEERTLTEEEVTKFNELKKKISEIDRDLKLFEDARELENTNTDDKQKSKEESDNGNDEQKEDEDKAADTEVRALFSGDAEEIRAAMNTQTNSEGGHIVKSTLAKEIIKELKDRSNVYEFFGNTNINGNYKIAKKTSGGKAQWIKENPEDSDLPDSTTPKLSIITLGQHRLYRESAITQQMINSQEINLNDFIKDDISESMTDAIEEAIFYGSGEEQPTGVISGIKQKVVLEERNVLSVDYFKKVKYKLKKAQWKKAKWFMHSDTMLQVDLLKDEQGRPLVQPDVTGETDFKILGIPVELSDSIKTMEETTEECIVVLATPEAYHSNTQKSIALYVYEDSIYKKKGLVGYGCDVYMDGKPVNDKAVAGIYNKAQE